MPLTAAERGVLIIRQVNKVIKGRFPKLFELMDALPDKRKGSNYKVSELITGSIALFLFKQPSRNALNNDRREGHFKENYEKVFKKKLPHMDTVDRYISELSPVELEQIKAAFISALIEQRVFHRFKLFGKYFTIAIDGTGVNSYKENNKEQVLLSKTSKNGVVTYYSHVVEAKLVTSSGLAISIATEWVTNETNKGTDKEFKKQDCEQKAFQRLAVKIKKNYPRLPVCILADGLYPNKTFMKTCKDNDWAYVVVLKDDSLGLLQQDIKDIEDKRRHSFECDRLENKGKTHINQKYAWIAEKLAHAGYPVYWLSCTETITHYDKNGKIWSVETPTRFVYLSSCEVNKNNIRSIAEAGRMRWKIENEGYNEQKNGGYNLGHKYSRKSFAGYQNYYQCMQIAHIINQLVEKSEPLSDLFKPNNKITKKHVWKHLLAWLTYVVVITADIEVAERTQVRLAG